MRNSAAVLEALPLAAASLQLRATAQPRPLWTPLPGPQTRALESEADEVLYGGQAGGGKTDLLIGLALTQHRRSVVFRREYGQLAAIVERGRELITEDVGRFNGSDLIWRLQDGRTLELGAAQHEHFIRKWQGRPHDFLGFDEGAHFTLQQYLFLLGWNRTTIPGQRCRVVVGSNPPTDADGEWLIVRFAPWLDPQHSNPAGPGELRWFAVIDGEDREVESGAPFEHQGETIVPRSRTFIPAALADNPYLERTGYRATLQALPEPLRSQLLYGDFSIGLQDDPWQAIPSSWIRAAQERWREDGHPADDAGVPLTLSQLGADIAEGGGDRTVLARRYADWLAPLEVHKGPETPDATVSEALVKRAVEGGGTACIDANGVGAAVFHLAQAHGVSSIGFVGSKSTQLRDRSGRLGFANLRAAGYWGLREALDPANGRNVALPPERVNPGLRAELAAPGFQVQNGKVILERKEDVVRRLGRSPDLADAVVLAFWGPTFDVTQQPTEFRTVMSYQPDGGEGLLAGYLRERSVRVSRDGRIETEQPQRSVGISPATHYNETTG